MENFAKYLILFLLLLSASAIKGFFQRGKRIYNGDTDNNLTYYAQLVYQQSSIFCGGAIVEKNWILTAAHCLEDKNISDVSIVCGTNQKISNWQLHEVADFKMHENYNNETFENDIGLVKLKDSLVLSEDQNIIKIRSSPLRDDEQLKVSGWGRVSAEGHYSRLVRSSILPVVKRQICQEKYYPEIDKDRIYENMFCAGSEGSHSCAGDSGGPAVDLVNGKANHLVGITSWGPRNSTYGCSVHAPNVYTNVINYHEWIEKNTNYTVNFTNPVILIL